MKKIMLFCIIAVIAAVVYWGCKKETPVEIPSEKAAITEANFNSTLSVGDFQVAINKNLNKTAIKTNPNDPAVLNLESIICICESKINFKSDCAPEVLAGEYGKAFNAIKKQANDAMMTKFGGQNGRILAFAVKEIGIPECA